VEPVEPVEPEPLVEEVEPAEPAEPVEPIQLAELVPPPQPEQAAPTEQEVVEVAPLPDIPPAKPEPPKPVAQAPAPPPAPLDSPAPAEEKLVEGPAAVQTAALPGVAGEVNGNTKFDDSGNDNATPGGGTPGGPGTYNAELSAWLQAHHEFPDRAQRRKMYGATQVQFTIDRQGNLLSYEIITSSGYKILDEAALDTLKRASPMPPMPAELAGQSYSPKIILEFNPPS
jgi:protein TonB